MSLVFQKLSMTKEYIAREEMNGNTYVFMLTAVQILGIWLEKDLIMALKFK